jgi:predicted DNA-binding ribbon-helix-helix protein
MRSVVAKRSIVIGKHKTSVSLEDQFWAALKEIAADRHLTLSELVSDIDSERRNGNLSSALRLFVLSCFRPADTVTTQPVVAEASSLRL